MPRTLAEYVEIERCADDVRCGLSDADVRRTSGVHFGGMEAAPWPRRDEARLLADAQARMDRVGTAPTMFKAF